jgi:hypothetical protein
VLEAEAHGDALDRNDGIRKELTAGVTHVHSNWPKLL